MVELETAYRHCQQLTREQARNFYYAFVTLPRDKRRAICASYAFCRLCDDAADEDIPLERKLELLREIESRLDAAARGQPEGPVFTALADTMARSNVPTDYYHEVIRGVEMDLTITRYADFEQLRTYCYRVASVVGLICVHVFGYKDRRALEYATDLGLAMQLTNILRDVVEDLGRGRIYLPQSEMARFGYSEEELRRGVRNQAFLELMAFQSQRAQEYFDSGLRLLPLLSSRSRACPAVLVAIYQRILDRIRARQFNVFNGRVSLSGLEKLLLTAKTWLKSILPLPGPGKA
ncbi:MAG: presqualene diphosphate synthase HpnD [Chloroflexota bacterium]|nr:presqualene diphosphate synthase HpnD [Chloroflexota bacterium]